MIKKCLAILLLLLMIPCNVQASFDSRVDITGGITASKRMSLWKIHQYKDTTLMRKYPLRYAPWLSYIYVDKYVEVKNINDYNCLVIKTDLKKLVINDAKYNLKFCKRFKVKGKRKKKIRQIYRYLLKTEYVPHVKTAREVFEKREGDCAGIASAFYVMCKVKKIPVRYIIGWVDDGCHAWNQVKIKGKWYHIDCTSGVWLTKQPWDNFTIMESW